ncbi:MAG: SURF1 family protein [Lysobacteraceae bacterium]
MSSSRLKWTVRLAGVLATGLFAMLAHWQWGRAEWKQSWLDEYSRALQAQAMPLDEALRRAGAADAAPLRVVLESVDLQGPRFLLDNQQRDGTVGVLDWVVVEQANRYWLLELGWLPMLAKRELPMLPALTSQAKLEAVLLPWPSQGIRLGANPRSALDGQAKSPLAYLDRVELEAALGHALQDRVIRLLPGANLGHRIDQLAMPNTLPPEKHRGYAMQWAALSLLTLSLLVLFIWKGRKT